MGDLGVLVGELQGRAASPYAKSAIAVKPRSKLVQPVTMRFQVLQQLQNALILDPRTVREPYSDVILTPERNLLKKACSPDCLIAGLQSQTRRRTSLPQGRIYPSWLPLGFLFVCKCS